MSNKSPNQILDDMLRIIEDSKNGNIKQGILLKNALLEDVSNGDKINAIEELKNEDMIGFMSIENFTGNPDDRQLYITFKGKLLLQRGGYVEKAKKEESLRFKEKWLKRFQLSLTIILAIGAGLSACFTWRIAYKTPNYHNISTMSTTNIDSVVSIKPDTLYDK